MQLKNRTFLSSFNLGEMMKKYNSDVLKTDSAQLMGRRYFIFQIPPSVCGHLKIGLYNIS